MEYSLKVKYNAQYLRESNPDDLENLMKGAYKKRQELRLSGEEVGTHVWGKIRKDIARIKTVFREGQYPV